MARSYDGTRSASAREEVERDKQQQAVMHGRIERGVVIGAIAIAGLAVVLNTGRCISYAGSTGEYRTQQAEAETTLTELQDKLQDPSSQNYVYKDPTVGNMKDTGQAIATLQNQIISAQQLRNNQSIQAQTVPGNNTVSDFGDHFSSSAQTGGAVTLDPTDLAPSGITAPDTETVEQDAATVPETTESSGSSYEYTPITDFNSIGTVDNSQTTSGNTVDNSSSMVSNAVSESTGRDLAQLMTEFKQKYYAQVVNNVDGNDVAWSWYGYWEFAGTYDYSVNETPTMKAVWICYEPSDTAHVKPLGFVTATYTEATKKFTNMTATYTQAYTKKAEGQANNFGQTFNNNNQTAGSSSTTTTGSNQGTLSPDMPGQNGQGSENEYKPNIVEDDADNISIEPDTSNNTNAGNNSSNTNSTSGSSTTNTTPANNPSGSATWNPGSDAGTTSGTPAGTWNPNGGTGNTGSWNPNGTTPAGSSNSSGSWTPAN